MFADRIDAGRVLAKAMSDAGLFDAESVVLALPRGGVPVGAEVARTLGAPLDVLIVRKVGAPFDPEFALGAVGEDGIVIVDAASAAKAGVDQEALAELVDNQQREVARRAAGLRSRFARLPLAGTTAVIVDDGAATGSSAAAAVGVARAHGAGRVVVAVPVASRPAVAWLRSLADAVVCPVIPESFVAVGHHYRDFDQVSDAEVLTILESARP